MKQLLIAAMAYMLIACNKEQNIKAVAMEANNSIVKIKAYAYTRSQLNSLLNQDGKKMDGVRFYHEGYAVGTLRDKEGNYNDYTPAGINAVQKKVGGLPCPDFCSK